MSASPHVHAPLSRQSHAPDTAVVSDAVPFSLDDLLALQAGKTPHAPFLASPQHDGLTLSFATAHTIVQNLCYQLAVLKLERGSAIAVLMPNHPHASLACLACLSAGLHPLLLPAHGKFSELAGLLIREPCAAIITVAIHDQSLPDMAMRLAAATDHVRFVMAFGHAPSKGIIALDPFIAAPLAHHVPVQEPANAILLPQPRGDVARVTVQALVAMATEHAAGSGLDAGERLICPLAQTTVQGLCCGLISALMTGAELCLLDAP
ncbi:MAG: AMP-binding protein, partial [Beijerinckiaceae bacterium]